MLVDQRVSRTSDIHKVKCYIVVVQEIGNIFLRSKLVIETPIKDICQRIPVCIVGY